VNDAELFQLQQCLRLECSKELSERELRLALEPYVRHTARGLVATLVASLWGAPIREETLHEQVPDGWRQHLRAALGWKHRTRSIEVSRTTYIVLPGIDPFRLEPHQSDFLKLLRKQ
jgi:hypothetical protein